MSGFNWDGETYTEGEGGGEFISEDEFDKLRVLDATVYVTGVREGISNYEPTKPKEQWLLDFVTPEGEDKTKGYIKGNAERDARFQRIKNTLAADPSEPIAISFVKVGRRNDIAAPKGE
jgi:hypothetical protein